MKRVPEEVSAYMAKIGAKGGKNGAGKRKVRTKEQARAAGIASGAARRRKAKKPLDT